VLKPHSFLSADARKKKKRGKRGGGGGGEQEGRGETRPRTSTFPQSFISLTKKKGKKEREGKAIAAGRGYPSLLTREEGKKKRKRGGSQCSLRLLFFSSLGGKKR